jgi:ssDNA-binding Zn-finger/Zn-ribbon topoisomerase 1
MTQVKAGMDTGLSCPQCEERHLVVKFGKNGMFLGCANYPACAFTSNYTRDSAGEIQLVKEEAPEELGPCPKCEDGRLVVKKTKTGGRFVACSNYPACRHTKSVGTGVACPKDGCDGELVEKPADAESLLIPAANIPNATTRSGTSRWPSPARCANPRSWSARRPRPGGCTWPVRSRSADSGKSWTKERRPQADLVFLQKRHRIVTELGLAQPLIAQILLPVDDLEALTAALQKI